MAHNTQLWIFREREVRIALVSFKIHQSGSCRDTSGLTYPWSYLLQPMSMNRQHKGLWIIRKVSVERNVMSQTTCTEMFGILFSGCN